MYVPLVYTLGWSKAARMVVSTPKKASKGSIMSFREIVEAICLGLIIGSFWIIVLD
jgi:hypothetical protein